MYICIRGRRRKTWHCSYACRQRQAVAESWLSFNTILDASIKMSNPRVYRNSLNFPRPQKRSQENVTRVRILLNWPMVHIKHTSQEINKMGLIQKWTIIKYKSVSTWPKSEIILLVNDVPSWPNRIYFTWPERSSWDVAVEDVPGTWQ